GDRRLRAEGPVPREDPGRDRGGSHARCARVVPRRQAERRDSPPDQLMTRRLKLGGAGALVLLLVLAATWTVRRLDGEDRAVAVTGTIEALQVDVSAKITARIVERTVTESQPVERGQLLVRLADAEPAARRGRRGARPGRRGALGAGARPGAPGRHAPRVAAHRPRAPKGHGGGRDRDAGGPHPHAHGPERPLAARLRV